MSAFRGGRLRAIGISVHSRRLRIQSSLYADELRRRVEVVAVRTRLRSLASIRIFNARSGSAARGRHNLALILFDATNHGASRRRDWNRDLGNGLPLHPDHVL